MDQPRSCCIFMLGWIKSILFKVYIVNLVTSLVHTEYVRKALCIFAK